MHGDGHYDYLANPSDSSTTITIPGHDVELTAETDLVRSKVVKYPLAVNNGSGSGYDIGGGNVFINADAPASGG